jgi:hypothetical protein
MSLPVTGDKPASQVKRKAEPLCEPLGNRPIVVADSNRARVTSGSWVGRDDQTQPLFAREGLSYNLRSGFACWRRGGDAERCGICVAAREPRRTKQEKWLIAILAAGLLVTGAAVEPAEAATGTWRAYTITSKWHCSQWAHIGDNVYQKACVVVNLNYVQAILIADNASSHSATISSDTVNLWSRIGGVDTQETVDHCLTPTTLGADRSRACFGHTISLPCTAVVDSNVRLFANGAHGYLNSPRRRMCV